MTDTHTIQEGIEKRNGERLKGIMWNELQKVIQGCDGAALQCRAYAGEDEHGWLEAMAVENETKARVLRWFQVRYAPKSGRYAVKDSHSANTSSDS